MEQKKKLGRKILSALLTLAVLIGLMPGMSLTAYADEITNITMDSNGTLKIGNQTWTAESSYYYLNTGNYTLGSNITVQYPIRVKGTVMLDLQGYNIEHQKNSQDTIEVTENSNLTVTGTGSIINNNFGSAVLVKSNGTLTLSGGNITNNGGDDKSRCEGVNVAGGVFTMNGGSITNNTKAVRIDEVAGTFIMNGGAISNNSQGVVLQHNLGSVHLSGNATISGNTTNNIYLYSGKTFSITESAFQSGAYIGVSTETTPTSSTDVKVATGAHKTDIQYIHSDNSANAGTIFCDGTNDWAYVDGVAQLRSGVTHHEHEANTVWLSVAANDTNILNNIKETQTITASDVNATYGDTNQSVSATTNGNGAISYAVKSGSENYISVASDGKLTIKKVPADGKAYVTVTADETSTGGTDNKGYAKATKEVTVTINKANAVPATIAANNLTYDGTKKSLVAADDSTLAGGTMYYALGTDASTAPANDLYTIPIPKKTNFGT